MRKPKQDENPRIALAIEQLEKRVRDQGCTDKCKSCKLEHCAREGTAAIVGELGDIEFLK